MSERGNTRGTESACLLILNFRPHLITSWHFLAPFLFPHLPIAPALEELYVNPTDRVVL